MSHEREFGIIGTVVEQQGLMQVESADLGKVYLFEPFGCEFVLIEMTVPGREGEIIRHNIDSLVRLTEDDPLFEPENDYRLVVSSRREDKKKRTMCHKRPRVQPASKSSRVIGVTVPVEAVKGSAGLEWMITAKSSAAETVEEIVGAFPRETVAEDLVKVADHTETQPAAVGSRSLPTRAVLIEQQCCGNHD